MEAVSSDLLASAALGAASSATWLRRSSFLVKQHRRPSGRERGRPELAAWSRAAGRGSPGAGEGGGGCCRCTGAQGCHTAACPEEASPRGVSSSWQPGQKSRARRASNATGRVPGVPWGCLFPARGSLVSLARWRALSGFARKVSHRETNELRGCYNRLHDRRWRPGVLPREPPGNLGCCRRTRRRECAPVRGLGRGQERSDSQSSSAAELARRTPPHPSPPLSRVLPTAPPLPRATPCWKVLEGGIGSCIIR